MPCFASSSRTASTSLSSFTANCACACFCRYSSRSFDFPGELRADGEILDLHFAARLLVAALDDGAGRVALVGIFQLLAEIVLRIAEIKLGADAGVAQRLRHALIVGDAVAVEHRDQHRA